MTCCVRAWLLDNAPEVIGFRQRMDESRQSDTKPLGETYLFDLLRYSCSLLSVTCEKVVIFTL